MDILDHGLQVAAPLAERHPDDAEPRPAGPVHHIGHQLVPADEASGGTRGLTAFPASSARRGAIAAANAGSASNAATSGPVVGTP